eukprot:3337996-Ditylum_brightwellii.AAC.1
MAKAADLLLMISPGFALGAPYLGNLVLDAMRVTISRGCVFPAKKFCLSKEFLAWANLGICGVVVGCVVGFSGRSAVQGEVRREAWTFAFGNRVFQFLVQHQFFICARRVNLVIFVYRQGFVDNFLIVLVLYGGCNISDGCFLGHFGGHFV